MRMSTIHYARMLDHYAELLPISSFISMR